MRWFHKPFFLAVALVLACGSAGAEDEAAKPSSKKGDRKKDEKKDEKKDDKKSKPEPAVAKGPPKLTVPVPPGHDAKGLVIPYRDEKGMMQMRFTMDVGSRTDEEHLAMKKLLIETFDAAGNPEMAIELPESKLNLATRVISTDSGVVIKRSDFELAGTTMEFNTLTRAGRLGGKVRMLIYNLENEINPTEEPTPREK